MSAAWLGWLFTVGAAQAQVVQPDVVVSWIEPTCEDAALAVSAEARAASVCSGRRPTRIVYQYRDARERAGCDMWVHAWCAPGNDPGYKPAGDVVRPTLYVDKDLKGQAIALGPGEYDLSAIPLRDGGEWSRKAGSLRVPAGWTVRLCDTLVGTSRCTDVTADQSDLGRTLVGNDTARHVQVVQGTLPPLLSCPRAYENDAFGGRSLDLCDDIPDLRSSPYNDMMSSILVPPGWSIEVCDGVAGVAPCVVLSTDQARLGDTLVKADRVTSVRVLSRP